MRERERKYTSDFSYLFLLFFFKGVVVVVDFFAFFRPNLGAQIEALESFTKREIPQRYIKFKHFGIPKDIHHSNAERCS